MSPHCRPAPAPAQSGITCSPLLPVSTAAPPPRPSRLARRRSPPPLPRPLFAGGWRLRLAGGVRCGWGERVRGGDGQGVRLPLGATQSPPPPTLSQPHGSCVPVSTPLRSLSTRVLWRSSLHRHLICPVDCAPHSSLSFLISHFVLPPKMKGFNGNSQLARGTDENDVELPAKVARTKHFPVRLGTPPLFIPHSLQAPHTRFLASSLSHSSLLAPPVSPLTHLAWNAGHASRCSPLIDALSHFHLRSQPVFERLHPLPYIASCPERLHLTLYFTPPVSLRAAASCTWHSEGSTPPSWRPMWWTLSSWTRAS